MTNGNKERLGVILLTACIKPNGMCYTKLQDENERLNQYVKAIKWYLNNTSHKIVVVENTNYSMPICLKGPVESGRLEYLTFCPLCPMSHLTK